jgi:8-oxo-dGTP pyrophosphatase MutT (NUDIX family)
MPKIKKSHCFVNDILTLDLAHLRKKYPDYNIRCGVLLVREEDGKLLIVKEKPRGNFTGNVFGPPKGSARRCDREYFDVALRELLEETGISASALDCVGPEFVMFHYYYREILFLFPLVVHAPPEPLPDMYEIEECRWMSIADLRNNECAESAYMRRLVSDLYTILVSGVAGS